MALAVISSSSSAAISGSNFPRAGDLKAVKIASFRLLDRPAAVNLSQKRSAVRPVNAEPKRNGSLLPPAATIAAPEVEEKLEAEDYEQLAKELANASPLEIMDKALEKFGDDITIAFSGAEM